MSSTQHSLRVIHISTFRRHEQKLLREMHGEFLLIRSHQIIWVCDRSARNMRLLSLSWFELVATRKNVRFIVGRLTEKGGRFQNISRGAAIELIAEWVFKAL